MPSEYYSKALQLHAIISSFCLALEQEVQRNEESNLAVYSPALGICFSALVALCDNHTCADLDDVSGVGTPEQLRIQQVSLQCLLEVGPSISEFASRLSIQFETDRGRRLASPFAAECLYSIAVQFGWYIQETGKTEYVEAVHALKHALEVIGQTWRVGSK